ncbi:NUDIX hydrolase [Microvirga sp. ACRRW]|uniref:NUDIX hydrolase n=1 Tax=Microvirga sp. ACRRW TaxID=2918205 RepID=UPI001EF6A4E6|nr:NUDIX hydrolase [Microvirga sp. ACRRW]MCG7392451.1 NUDIX hydrolase [Microvirga sp. ACRRW]
MTWKVERSLIVFRDRWVSLRADDCTTPKGVDVSPFYVLEYSDWVHVVAIDADEHIVLIRQYRHGLGVSSLELPGGGMDARDEGPVAAAIRELAEETGYTAASCRLVASLSPNPATHNNRVHVILAEGAALTQPPAPEADEDITVLRVPVKEAVRSALAGEMVQAQHVGLLMIGLKAAGLLEKALGQEEA